MPTCPKCGFDGASALACPHCRATFSRPLVLEDEPSAPVASSALSQELQLDRRSSARSPAPEPFRVRPENDEPAWAVAGAQAGSFETTDPGTPPFAETASSPPADAAPPAPSVSSSFELLPPDGTPAVAAPRQSAQSTAVSSRKRAETARSASEEQEIEIHADPAGPLSQIGAFLIDAIVLGALFAVYLAIAQWIAGEVPPSQETGFDWLIDRALAWKGVLVPGVALLAALSFVYTSLFHGLGGRTLGKRVFGLTLVDGRGQPPRLRISALRALLAFGSAALLMFGFWLVLFDRKRQALHDKLTGTHVVRLAG